MAPDETTQLLVKPASDPGCCPEEWDGKTATAQTSQIFALWQIGALCGILLAYADTSLVWATHETVASRFDNLENSSWMMTSFTIGYCVTLPLKVIPEANLTSCKDIAVPSNVAVLRSYVNIASTVGLSLGGPLGGFLGGTIGWRWSFLGQVPLATGCCVLLAGGLRTFLPVLKEEDERQHEESATDLQPDLLTFDYPGAITLAIWISSLLAVIDLQNQLSWGHPLVLSITIVGVLAILAFLALETYPGNRELLIPLRLLKTEVGAFCAGQFISQIAPYFANTQGASDAKGGGQIILPSIGNAIGNLVAGQVIRKFGNYKKLSLISLFFCIATSLLILLQWSHSISTWEALATFPFGLFAGIVLSTQFIGLYHCAPRQHMAIAISMYYMSQQIGIALGISISSALLKQEFKNTLQKTLIVVPNYQEIIKNILMDSSVVAMLPTDVKELVRRSYLNSFWVVPALATSTQVLAILPMISTTEKYSD
ncbi:uncharacterized protein K444DRAFT_630453 [Hyaloscypha bicolor E]|uniref:MFS general substrate transporter n=1 Tax=Hyaloscypha bicolor E TaxID=1095630 RepID=A0A2J6T6W4_9HELO|nr:uncharacterized protein K444DRAFT_630453 [Hyaloscypha bicolor E]PMD58769.1 hypothetical protein K444DRAFT_630453 [Hyaloscypha bicolor E]